MSKAHPEFKEGALRRERINNNHNLLTPIPGKRHVMAVAPYPSSPYAQRLLSGPPPAVLVDHGPSSHSLGRSIPTAPSEARSGRGDVDGVRNKVRFGSGDVMKRGTSAMFNEPKTSLLSSVASSLAIPTSCSCSLWSSAPPVRC